MRHIYTFALLLLPSFVFSQSALFIGIGLDTGAVRTMLEEKDYLRHLREDSAGVWTAHAFPHQTLSYRFFDGILYAIEDTRSFSDAEKVDQLTASCLAYLKLLDYDTKTVDASSGSAHYVAVTFDQVVEFVKTRQGDSYECTLRVTSRRHGPRMKTESFVAQVSGL